MSYCNQLNTQQDIIKTSEQDIISWGQFQTCGQNISVVHACCICDTVFVSMYWGHFLLLKILISNTVCPPQIQLETKGGPIQTLAVHDVTKFYNDDIVAGDSLGTVTVFCNQQILSRHGLAKSSIRCLQIHKDPCKLGYYSLIVLSDLVVKVKVVFMLSFVHQHRHQHHRHHHHRFSCLGAYKYEEKSHTWILGTTTVESSLWRAFLWFYSIFFYFLSKLSA